MIGSTNIDKGSASSYQCFVSRIKAGNKSVTLLVLSGEGASRITMRSVATSNPYPPPIDIAESRSAGSRFASAPPIIGESESRDIGLAKGGELSSLALLRTLDPISLAALEAELVRICVAGGETLFRENDFADALYIVIAGFPRGNCPRQQRPRYAGRANPVRRNSRRDGASRRWIAFGDRQGGPGH